jgi:hypothetical protein
VATTTDTPKAPMPDLVWVRPVRFEKGIAYELALMPPDKEAVAYMPVPELPKVDG